MDKDKEKLPFSEDRVRLQSVKGIGNVFAKALHKIGIHDCADLSAHTPQQLAALLSQDGDIKIKPERIESEDWIGQAQRLNQQKSNPSNHQQTADDPISRKPGAEPERGKQQAWNQYAGFSLFFDYVNIDPLMKEWQTHLYHEESGKEAYLSGTETAVWAEWIENQAQLPAPANLHNTENTSQVKNALTAMSPDMDLEINHVGIMAVPGSFDNIQYSIHFSLRGSDSLSAINQGGTFQIELLLFNLNNNTIEQFTESSLFQLRPGQLDYFVTDLIPMPATGRYEIQTIVYLHAPAQLLSTNIGPIVNIG